MKFFLLMLQKKLGVERAKGTLSDSLRFSRAENHSVRQDSLDNAEKASMEIAEKIFLKKVLTRPASCGIIPSLSEDSRFR